MMFLRSSLFLIPLDLFFQGILPKTRDSYCHRVNSLPPITRIACPVEDEEYKTLKNLKYFKSHYLNGKVASVTKEYLLSLHGCCLVIYLETKELLCISLTSQNGLFVKILLKFYLQCFFIKFLFKILILK